MKRRTLVPIVGVLALLAACGEDETAGALPPPVALTRDAVGHYCGMLLVEHAGPKGQALMRGTAAPIWFSSARDAIAFTHLAERPRAIAAVYVSDMAKAESWDDPGATIWVDARQAFFVLGSTRRGGMGAEEAVPFSVRVAADRFVAEHGGHVVTFTGVPRDWALGGESAGSAPASAPPPARHVH